MNAVVKHEQPAQQTQIATISDSATLIQAIARAASDPAVDVEKMERLMAMHREMQQQQAEVAFNEAMARVQSRMGRISTDKRNDQTRSNYATYGKLDRVLRPLYAAEGFALSFGTDAVDVVDMVRVTCHVTHQAGFTRKYLIDMPADGKGAKGNDVMTKTHATGSATQYGMRYLLKMIFNVAIGDEDDDGNAAAVSEPEFDISGWRDAIDDCDDKAALDRLAEELRKTTNIPDYAMRNIRGLWAQRARELAK
jgi:hypothetical protein